MGFLDSIRNPRYASGWQRPWDKKFAAEIIGIENKDDRKAILQVNIYTGEESPWQAPMRDDIRAIIPDGVRPEVGQRITVGTAGGGSSDSNSPRPVRWDDPAPELPPMQFPNIPGGNDPKVMLVHLAGLVKSGALDEDGLERARNYLEA